MTAPVVEKKEDGHLDDVPGETALAAMTTDVGIETIMQAGRFADAQGEECVRGKVER